MRLAYLEQFCNFFDLVQILSQNNALVQGMPQDVLHDGQGQLGPGQIGSFGESHPTGFAARSSGRSIKLLLTLLDVCNDLPFLETFISSTRELFIHGKAMYGTMCAVVNQL